MMGMLLGVGVVACLFAGGGFLVTFLKRQKELMTLQQKQLDVLMQDQKALLAADILFSDKLKGFLGQLKQLDNRLECLEQTREKDGGYQYALKLLQSGSSKEEIIGACHLSHAEAELLSNLNAYKKLKGVTSKD